MAQQVIGPINPAYKLLVWVNILLCGGTLFIMLIVCNSPPDSPYVKKLFDTCETIFKMTSGAFIGLLGGRASIPSSK